MTQKRKSGISYYPDDETIEKIIKYCQVEKRSKGKAVDCLVEIALSTPEVKRIIEYKYSKLKAERKI